MTITLADAGGGTEVLAVHDGLLLACRPRTTRRAGERRSRSSPRSSRPGRTQPDRLGSRTDVRTAGSGCPGTGSTLGSPPSLNVAPGFGGHPGLGGGPTGRGGTPCLPIGAPTLPLRARARMTCPSRGTSPWRW
jgi:hypothetical protein